MYLPIWVDFFSVCKYFLKIFKMHSYTKVSVLFICAKIEQGLLKKRYYSPISARPCKSVFPQSLILLNSTHLALFTHTI